MIKITLARKGEDTMVKLKNTPQSRESILKKCCAAFGATLLTIVILAASSVGAADLMHNSKDTGSTKWPGGWGIPGGRYGNFTCATCHEPNAKNIKNIRKTISVMNNTSTTHTLPNGQLSAQVVFKNVTSMGDDSTTHNTSSRICEVCHSQTLFHNADSGRTLPANRNHPSPKAVCTTCHSHNTGFKAACGGCHGNPPTSATLGGYSGMVGTPRPSRALPPGNAGAHREHAKHELVCDTCHYISDGSTRMPSLSNTIQLGFFGFGGKVTSGTFKPYSGANRGYATVASTPNTTIASVSTAYVGANLCSNVYCHGGGVVTGGTTVKPPLTGGNVTFWSWTSHKQSTCGSCHGASAANPPTTANHVIHAKSTASGNYQIACEKCHPATGYTDNSHVQGNLRWELDTADQRIGATATYRGAYKGTTDDLAPSDPAAWGQCANVYCHSNGAGGPANVVSPTWGNASGFSGCVGCHGGNALSTSPITHNAHKAHVKNESAAYNGIAYGCAECHSAVVTSDTSVSDRTLHVNTAKDVSWGPKATGGQAYSGSCANIYCHSNGQGAFKTPAQSWTGTTDGQEGTAQCNFCHGGQNGQFDAVSSNRHRNHIGNIGRPVPHAPVTCAACHVRTVSSDGTAIAGGSAGRHINKSLDVNMKKFANLSGAWTKSSATCANSYCHGQQTVTWTNATILNCEGCHRASNYTSGVDNSGLSKAHLKHYNTATPPTNAAADGWAVQNRSVATNVFTCGVCHPTDPATTHVNGATANGTAAETVTVINLPFSVNKPGANLSNAVNRGAAPINTDGRGFQFSSGTTCSTYCHSDGKGGAPKTTASWSSTTMSCGDCHNKAGDASPSWSGAHSGHLNSNISSVTCNSCHAGTASGNNTLIANRRDRHPNGFVNVTGNSVAGSLSYNGDTCANVYCHPSNSPSWEGGTLDGKCVSCHGGNVASVNPIDTNGHRAHVHNDAGRFKNFNFQCYECHFNTVFRGDTSISTKANHINGSKNVAWGPRADGTGTLAFDPALKCTTYCHSNGAGLFKNPPKTWSAMSSTDEGTINCDYCHKGIFGNNSTVSSGRHTNHVTDSGTIPHVRLTCNDCHSQTVAADGQSIFNGTDVKHINKALDVTFLKMGNFSGNWTKGTNTCNNTWCHAWRPQNWLTGSNTCGSCHAASRSATYGLSSSHGKHYYTTTNASAANGWLNDNRSGTTGNIFGCGTCHEGWGGVAEQRLHHVNGPAAANGSAAEVVLRLPFTVPAGANRSETVFRGMSGLGRDGAGYMFSRGTNCNTYCHSDGRGGDPKAVMRWAKVTASCGNCHNKSGDDPATTTWSKAHDKHGTAYNGNTTVTCAACHYSTASNNTTLRSRRLHPNGFRNISVSTAVGTGAFKWNPDTQQCKNGYCHGQGRSFTDYSTGFISWGGNNPTPTQCNSCHAGGTTTGPSYANGTNGKANSHPKHHGEPWGFSCDYCHYNVTSNGTTITNVVNHVNKAYNINPNTSRTFIGQAVNFTATASTSPPTTKSSCTNVYCHGGALNKVFVWGASNKCGDCHFANNDVVNYGFNNSTMAKIGRAEWSYSGHGKQSGTYDVTGNPFAGFSTAARVAGATGDQCLYCHEYDAVPHGNVANPMRLRNFNDPVYGKNGVCLACHATGAKGVEPFAAYSTKSARKRVDKTHYYNKHSASLNGGQFCWDCHDGHGDRTTANAGPIAMVQKRPAKASDATTGVPSAFTNATSVRFIARAAAGDFAKTTAPFNGVCNVCHTYKVDDPNKMVHYTDNSSDSHRSTALCTTCHKHSMDTAYNGEAYRGVVSGCNGCHGGNNNGNLSVSASAGHAIHYNRTSVFRHYTGSNRHTATAYAFACKNCHGATESNHDNSANNIALAGGWTYTAGTAANDTLGYAYTNGTCGQNSCHQDGRNGAPKTSTFAWNGTKTSNCDKCHFDMSVNASATGSHVKHTQAGGAAYGCSVCHGTGYSATTVSFLTHIDNKMNISFTGAGAGSSYNSGTSFSLNTPYSTCSSTNCHGSGTVTWGGTLWSTTVTCAKCHGTASGTFYSTSYPVQVTSNANAKVGAHFNHLSSNGNRISRSANCKDCHLMPATVTAAGHLNGSSSPTYPAGSLALGLAGTIQATYSSATNSCATTYCHGSKLASNSKATGAKLAAIVKAPRWATPFLSANHAVSPTAADCGACHGFPPRSAAHTAVAAYAAYTASQNLTTAVGSNCSNCHKHFNANGTLTAAGLGLHINGAVEGGDCVGCHTGAVPAAAPKRIGAAGQFTAQSHHIQGRPVTTADCYQCHWEANSDGSINSSYHDQTSG
ncbi:CxxxxCH/CxxCH domain-containing protein, partial [Geobacter pelophilus]